MRTQAERALLDRFAVAQPRLPNAGAMRTLRSEAFATFSASGLPHRRTRGDAWHYTDLRALVRDVPPIAPEPDGNAIDSARTMLADSPLGDAHRIVLVDGTFVPELSSGDLVAGVSLTPLATAMADEHAALGSFFGQSVVEAQDNTALVLNAAFVTDGMVLDVAAGTSIPRAIHVTHMTTGSVAVATHTRLLVRVGQGAAVTLVESFHATRAAHQINAVTEIWVEDGARVDHVRVDRTPELAILMPSLLARLGATANFETFGLSMGGALTRNQIFVTFAGDDAKAGIRGVVLVNGRQHCDTTLVVDHAALGGESRELFKHVIDGASTGVFQGKIIVRPGAQKTDGRMMSQALLMSDDGTMNNKPELEIFADDVQCAHGATCGALDDNLLFYLMARGLPRAEAEALLLEAFVAEAIDEVRHEPTRDWLSSLAGQWLAARHGAEREG
jgi:Fe-S cluster assembly protein SufD